MASGAGGAAGAGGGLIPADASKCLPRASGAELPTPELVLNQVSGVDEARALARKLGGVCEQFLSRSPQLAGWLPRAGAIEAGALRQRPFVLENRNSLETSSLRRLSERVTRRFGLLKAQAGAGR